MQDNPCVIFKTEANKDIGSGHFVRCLILADEFVKKNIRTFFVFADTEEHYRELLTQKGHGYKTINKQEAIRPAYYKELAKELNSSQPFVVFDTDNRAYTKESFQIFLKEEGIPFMHITVNDQETYHSNILLCQNIIAFKQNYHTDDETVRLLGPQYFIYKLAYRNTVASEEKVFDLAKITCLICFGGADKKNLSLQIAKLIHDKNIHGIKMDIVVGASYPYLDEMKTWVQQRTDVQLYHNTSDMYRIMQDADLAITSGGLILWEAAVLNKPLLAIATSEREIEPLAYLKELDYITYLGNADQWDKKLLISCLVNAKDYWKKFQDKVKKFKSQINPEGVSLVIENVIKVLEWKRS